MYSTVRVYSRDSAKHSRILDEHYSHSKVIAGGANVGASEEVAQKRLAALLSSHHLRASAATSGSLEFCCCPLCRYGRDYSGYHYCTVLF